MTVFSVFFLVLVIRVVHSHGRAYETESIMYNNSQQPYKENLFPVDYDYFYLVMLWRNSFSFQPQVSCNLKPITNFFIVHGLWPQRNDGVFVDYSNVPNTSPFNSRRV